MECGRQSLQAQGLSASAVSYQYRYCPRCRREWPAKQQSCPECIHWLGDRPLERTEWQLAPEQTCYSAAQSYELVGASAFVVRIIRPHRPDDEQITAINNIFNEILALEIGTTSELAGRGWLIWTRKGLRHAFQMGRGIEQRLTSSLPRLAGILHHTAAVRWGIWIDQYVIPFDGHNRPAIKNVTACAIFNFEPDNVLLSSNAVYQANRHWEYFVGVPRRLLGNRETFGYRMAGHKQPSALDCAETGDASHFIGRKRELSKIEQLWSEARHIVTLAITAPAGSGKTRLIREWLRNHQNVRAIAANFSLFGGAVTEFASQLAELPPDRLDCGALVEAVVRRVHRDKIEVLVLDDLHWADAEGLEFLQSLIAALPPIDMFVILVARPSGRKQLQALQPKFELKLSPLPKAAIEELARQLMTIPAAVTAALRSRGNPLFVEQFAAWSAEVNFRGGPSGPRTLYQIIAARIEHLSSVRIGQLRQRLRWGRAWERQDIDDELGQLEGEVGLWLDRLEAGDYADRMEAARHLVHLRRLDYEIFLTSMLVGRPRARSGRLYEAIERLLLGSADQILQDLKRRATKATSANKDNISREAKQAADVLFTTHNWALAAELYQLAHSGALWERDEIDRRLGQCWRHSRDIIRDDSEVYSSCAESNLNERPDVDGLDLPYVWVDLGRRFRCSRYFARANKAAEAINDRALAVWAKRKAQELCANKEDGCRGEAIDEAPNQSYF